MQKQEQLLKEDPFLCDANWNLVWRWATPVLAVIFISSLFCCRGAVLVLLLWLMFLLLLLLLWLWLSPSWRGFAAAAAAAAIVVVFVVVVFAVSKTSFAPSSAFPVVVAVLPCPRYLPLFTAESYFTRLSKGYVTLSADEVWAGD